MRLMLKACVCLAVLTSSSAVSQDLQLGQQLKLFRDISSVDNRAFQLAASMPRDGNATARGWVGREPVANKPIDHGSGYNSASMVNLSTNFNISPHGATLNGIPLHSVGFDIADQRYNIWLGNIQQSEVPVLAARPNIPGNRSEVWNVLRLLSSLRIDFRF